MVSDLLVSYAVNTRTLFTCLLAVWMQWPAQSYGDECVVLLHGLMRSGLSMKGVEWRLESEGYQVANITYPSLLYSIEELAKMAIYDYFIKCMLVAHKRARH